MKILKINSLFLIAICLFSIYLTATCEQFDESLVEVSTEEFNETKQAIELLRSIRESSTKEVNSIKFRMDLEFETIDKEINMSNCSSKKEWEEQRTQIKQNLSDLQAQILDHKNEIILFKLEIKKMEIKSNKTKIEDEVMLRNLDENLAILSKVLNLLSNNSNQRQIQREHSLVELEKFKQTNLKQVVKMREQKYEEAFNSVNVLMDSLFNQFSDQQNQKRKEIKNEVQTSNTEDKEKTIKVIKLHETISELTAKVTMLKARLIDLNQKIEECIILNERKSRLQSAKNKEEEVILGFETAKGILNNAITDLEYLFNGNSSTSK